MGMKDVPDRTAAAELPDDASADQTDRADEALAQMRRERDAYYDQLLRTRAEFDNYRKRIERERRDAADRAVAAAVDDLLPIVDDFERALQSDAAASVESYREGLEIIRRRLLDLLARRGVKPIEAVGQTFDPHFHEAMAYEPSPGRREGEVIEEVRRGYMLGDRLLRPSLVKVARA
jgi:molecular chaperone GrpE